MSGQILREGKALLTLYSSFTFTDNLGLFSERGTALETDGFHQNSVDVRALCSVASTEEKNPRWERKRQHEEQTWDSTSPGLLTQLLLEISGIEELNAPFTHSSVWVTLRQKIKTTRSRTGSGSASWCHQANFSSRCRWHATAGISKARWHGCLKPTGWPNVNKRQDRNTRDQRKTDSPRLV